MSCSRPLIVIMMVTILGQCLAGQAFAHVEASRCGWDPSCVCVTWFGEAGARVEVRCPEGSDSEAGWTQPGASGASQTEPDIVAPGGSFVGDGNITTTFLKGRQPEGQVVIKLEEGLRRSKNKLQHDSECKALFNNSPLTENGAWLLSKIQFRDGTGVHHSSGVIPCAMSGAVAWAESAEKHKLQVFVCPDFFSMLSDDEAAVTIIHETLHVAGQAEDSSNQTAGPGDHPSSIAITEAVIKACNLTWHQPL